MKIRLRGCRGSIPVPGPTTVKYGGNTTCHEIITDDGDLVIIDGGSGIRQLGLDQMAHLPLKVTLLITHTHWDHIQGIPFYTPLFVPGNKIQICGTFDPVYGKELRDILAGQMEYCYFPICESELNADITYTDLQENDEITLGSTTITPIIMSHPVLNYGYRIASKGKSFFFTGDYEPATNIYQPNEEGYELYQQIVDEQNQVICDFMKDVDVAVMDAQYTSEEYATKQGWGHGTYDSCISLAEKAKVKKLYLTHHDPTRTDDQLDYIYSELQEKYAHINCDIQMAKEGVEIVL
ncbi:MAG: MBL fold metallo-hydrolase [Pseudomonadales bacterium]|nr:MBL fold metallo-hydrolase [Pseudomonadales bacterium]